MSSVHKLQERVSALTDNKPLPALYSSTDVRSLKMDDFRFAHEQVRFRGSELFIYFLGCDCHW